MAHGALADAREAFENGASERYRRMAPVIGRLAGELARDGPFGVAGGSWMWGSRWSGCTYVLDEGRISRRLRNLAAKYLATNAAGQETIRETAQEFYDVRSDIVHNRLNRLSPERVHAVFGNGFDIARRSPFKMLREGPPEAWNSLGPKGALRASSRRTRSRFASPNRMRLQSSAGDWGRSRGGSTTMPRPSRSVRVTLRGTTAYSWR